MCQDLGKTLHDPEEGRGIGLTFPHVQDPQAELEHASPLVASGRPRPCHDVPERGPRL
jgi:hypothetical protein